MITRIYAVQLTTFHEGLASIKGYLVDAANVNAAIRHVAKKHITAKPADGKTVACLMANGVRPEAVGDAETSC